MVDYSKSIMEIVEAHLSPTPQYVDGRKRFGADEVIEDGETDRIIGEVEGAVRGAIAADVKTFAGGLMRKTRVRKRTTGKKK